MGYNEDLRAKAEMMVQYLEEMEKDPKGTLKKGIHTLETGAQSFADWAFVNRLRQEGLKAAIGQGFSANKNDAATTAFIKMHGFAKYPQLRWLDWWENPNDLSKEQVADIYHSKLGELLGRESLSDQQRAARVAETLRGGMRLDQDKVAKLTDVQQQALIDEIRTFGEDSDESGIPTFRPGTRLYSMIAPQQVPLQQRMRPDGTYAMPDSIDSDYGRDLPPPPYRIKR